jgi:ABC-type Fe3+-hydroxamate transport system substrate-binding protein
MADSLEFLGLKNVAQDSQIKYPTWSTEQVIRSAPELIIELPMGSENTLKKNKARLDWWQRFTSIPAVKDQRILTFPIEEFRAVPDLPKALRKLAQQIPK